MNRRYKERTFQQVYDTMTRLAFDSSSEFYNAIGPRTGATHRNCFWAGFSGGKRPVWVGAPGTMGNACYMAGKDFRAYVSRTPGQILVDAILRFRSARDEAQNLREAHRRAGFPAGDLLQIAKAEAEAERLRAEVAALEGREETAGA